MSTLLLDTALWDLCLTASGDIAAASEPYALAQDAATAIRLFQGELWYDTSQGIPYFSTILGQAPSVQLMKTYFIAAAMTVPGVVAAQCFLSGYDDRRVTGQVQVTDTAGVISAASF